MANDTELTGLIVKIKGDLTDYQTKLDQMQSQTAKASDSVASKFNAMGSAMATAGIAMGAFAATAINSAMQWGTAVNKLAKQTGMGADEASKFLVIAKRVGIDTDTASMMFAKLAKTINTSTKEQTTANAEGKKAGDVFTQLGIATLDANGHMRSSSDIFSDVKTKLAGMQDGWQKTAIEMEIFGKTGYQLNGLINMTSAEMKDAIDMAQSLGLILTDETAPAWAKLSKEINAAKGLLSSAGITIGNELMPVVKEIINDITATTKAFSNMNPEVRSGIIEIAKLGGEIGIASAVIGRTIGVIGGVTEALGIMKLATWAAAGPWVSLAAAIVIAINALDQYSEAKYKTEGYNKEAEVRKFTTDDGTFTQHQVKRQKNVYGINVQSWENMTPGEEEEQVAFENRPKPQPTVVPPPVNLDPFIGGDPNAGSSKAKGPKEKTDLQKYIEQLRDIEDITSKQVDFGEISKEQEQSLLQQQLEGLQAVSVGQDEELDKERAIYDLKSKLRSLEKDQIAMAKDTLDRDYAAKTINEEDYYQGKMKNLQREYDFAIWGSNEQIKIQKSMYDLQDQHNEKQSSISLSKINSDQTFATANLRIESEQLRHRQAMSKIGDQEGDTASKLKVAEQSEQAIIAAQLKIDIDASNARIAILTKDGEKKSEEVKKELEQQKLLHQKYDSDILVLDDNLAEKQKQLEQAKIDANNATISALIEGTKSGHDVLKDMWFKFVDQIVAKMFSINAETNIFTQLFGKAFGLGSSSGGISASENAEIDNAMQSISISGARASGGPVTAGQSYIVGEKRPEIFVPSVDGTIIPDLSTVRSSNNTGSGTAAVSNSTQTVNVTQNFTGQQDSSVVAQIKGSIPYIKAEIINSMRTESGMRSAVKGAAR